MSVNYFNQSEALVQTMYVSTNSFKTSWEKIFGTLLILVCQQKTRLRCLI